MGRGGGGEGEGKEERGWHSQCEGTPSGCSVSPEICRVAGSGRKCSLRH